MISFAGGLPAPASFPDLSTAAVPRELLQYGASEGEPELRLRIWRELADAGLVCAPEQVLVLSGSQQGIDLVAKMCVDQGTAVALESPGYLAALQVFRFFGARFITLDPDRPQQLLQAPERPALCYVVPTFQNPTGRCHTAAQRERLAHTCMTGGITLFEDDPYRDLVYEPCDLQPVCSHMTSGSWIYQGSFSKTFAPGLRLGFLACSPDLLPYVTRLKQAADLHSNRLSQHLVLQQLQHPHHAQRLMNLRAHYKARRDHFAATLHHALTPYAEWHIPPGGLFFWLRLKTPVDTQALLQRAIAQGVAFMPGEPFFHQPPQDRRNYLRLNFSHASEEETEVGLRILADLLDACISEQPR
jgi:DNA-binding transcriptional MocR family regulator